MAAAGTGATSPRATRRALQQEVGRTQVLDAAEEVFGRRGFHETTLKEVADLAEFSVGSLYSFFDGKDELFRKIFLRRGDEFMPELRAVLADGSADPVAQLHALVDFQVGFFRRHPHFGRLYLRYSSATSLSDDRVVDAVIRDRYEEAMDLQAGLIERGQAEGSFHPGDPEVLGRLFSGLLSAYQALDPPVVTGDPAAGERLPLRELHAVVERTFVRSGGATRG